MRHHRPVTRTTGTRGTRPQRQPQPADWLVLTDADRALADLDRAFTRTSRWQGDTG